MTEESGYKVRTPLFPTYSKARNVIRTWNNVKKSSVSSVIQSVNAQTGTPQDPVDWSEPDKWIPERLQGEDAHLAQRIWQESNKTVNPRHIRGAYYFINRFNLLAPDSNGIYKLTERGKAFLENDAQVLRELDEAEGLLKLLNILATKTQAVRADILGEWSEFLQEYSRFNAPSSAKDTLRRRLLNLAERGYILKEANRYTITKEGLRYAEHSLPPSEGPKRKVLKAINQHNASQREALRNLLDSVNPFYFEQIIGDLMEVMGYEDVTVTKASGDKGVDVVATVQSGITTVREVVQVKRHGKSSIQRSVIDQLRGSLPYYQAIRGTLITLGKIGKGATDAAVYPGAAPITLIDGEKLLDLLIEHGIGMKKRAVELWEVDSSVMERESDIEGTDIEENP